MKFFSTAQHPGPVIAASFTTKQDDYAPAGLRHGAIIRWNGAGTTGISGLSLAAGRVATIVNASTDYLLWLENQNTASAAENRLMLPDAFPAFLMPGDCITLWKDGTTNRVRVLSWPTRGPQMGFEAYCDSVMFGNGIFGVQAGTGATAGVASSSSNWTTHRGHGMGVVLTGTSGTGRAVIGSSALYNFIPGHGCALVGARCAALPGVPTGTETWSGYVGFSDLGDGTIGEVMAWEQRWNGSAAEWTKAVAAGGSFTRDATSTPTPTNSAMQDFFVFLNADQTRADFIFSEDKISYTLSGSASSGLPVVSTSGKISAMVGAVATAGVSSRGLYWDWIGYRTQGFRG